MADYPLGSLGLQIKAGDGKEPVEASWRSSNAHEP